MGRLRTCSWLQTETGVRFRSWGARTRLPASNTEQQQFAVEEGKLKCETKTEKGKMDKELKAATRLLLNIISKRGEKIKENYLEQLALCAKKKGKLNGLSLVFSEAEWHEIGDMLWDCAIGGGKDGKIAQELGAVWKKVLITLQTVSAEKKAAEAAIQALEGAVDERKEVQKPSRVAKFFGVYNTCPMKGAVVLVSPTLQDVIDHVSQAAEVSPPGTKQTEREQEVAQPPGSGGMVKDEESGGAEGGTGLAQGMKQGGGVQDGDRSEAVQPPPSPENEEVAEAARAGVAPPPTAAAADAAVAQPSARTQHATTAAQCPLPMDSDSEISETESPSSNSQGKQRSQKKLQRANELQQIITKLAELSKQQDQLEKQTTVIPQPWSPGEHNPFPSSPTAPPAPSIFPSAQLVPLPAVPKYPIERHWSAVVKDAILDGDWQTASSVWPALLLAIMEMLVGNLMSGKSFSQQNSH
ncbi:hypothetical protein HGM15179_017604 [Zosterops borbonicus]|uniref:Uncharacterized protein n=1 Tax=Zosterops borbonicus TaxID=364589 RepID=A0A8K1G0M3_9PASS|nr:hypothetical protein HGM15179_017604 [Zosterops borbonicus]